MSDCLENRVAELERINVIVFGHGAHPGKLSEMQAHLRGHEERLTALEQVRWRLAGAVMLAGTMTGVVLFVIDKLLSMK